MQSVELLTIFTSEGFSLKGKNVSYSVMQPTWCNFNYLGDVPPGVVVFWEHYATFQSAVPASTILDMLPESNFKNRAHSNFSISASHMLFLSHFQFNLGLQITHQHPFLSTFLTAEPTVFEIRVIFLYFVMNIFHPNTFIFYTSWGNANGTENVG